MTTTRGGKRPGAGRPPRPLVEIGHHKNPQAFLEAVMNDDRLDLPSRLRAASILMAAERRQQRSDWEEIPIGERIG